MLGVKGISPPLVPSMQYCLPFLTRAPPAKCEPGVVDEAKEFPEASVELMGCDSLGCLMQAFSSGNAAPLVPDAPVGLSLLPALGFDSGETDQSLFSLFLN